MHRLDRIQIAGFKSIRDQTLDLRPLNVLIGANGAGKSNFIQVFRMLHEIVNQDLQIFVGRSGGADRLLHFGSKMTEEIFFEIRFGSNGYQGGLTPAVDAALIFKEERIYGQESDYLSTGHRETQLLQEEQE